VKYEGHFHGVEELKKHGVSSGVYLLHWNKKTLQLRVP
jgi:hypothetical protein